MGLLKDSLQMATTYNRADRSVNERSIVILDISMASKGDNQIAFRLFWTKVNPDDGECLKYKCKICDIERTKNKSGYTNLSSHLDDKHKNWRKVVERAKSK